MKPVQWVNLTLLIFLAVIAGCETSSSDTPGKRVNPAPQRVFLLVGEELRARLPFEFIDYEDLFSRYKDAMADGLGKYPHARTTVSTFYHKKKDMLVIRADVSDLKVWIAGGDLNPLLSKLAFEALASADELLRASMAKINLQDVQIDAATSKLSIVYQIPQYLTVNSHLHLSTLKAVFHGIAEFYPASEKITIKETVGFFDDQINYVVVDYLAIETSTRNAIRLATGEISDMEFMRHVKLVSLFKAS
jgi:hypothetical protein